MIKLLNNSPIVADDADHKVKVETGELLKSDCEVSVVIERDARQGVSFSKRRESFLDFTPKPGNRAL